MINTVTGAVYFGTDEDTQAKLNAAAEAYIHEIPGVEYFGANWFGVYVLPEGTDPSEFDRDAIKKQLKEEHGLQLGRLRIVG